MERESIREEINEIFERMSSPEYTKKLVEIENMLEDDIQLDDIDEATQINGTLPERKNEIKGNFVR